MAALLRPLPRLLQLMREHGTSPRDAARVIGRSEGYLRKRLTGDTYVLDLPADELVLLAGFFGVPIEQLGG